MPWKSNEDYIKESSLCPRCNSCEIVGHSVDIEGGSASQRVGCNECDAVWYDVYQLIGYQVDAEISGTLGSVSHGTHREQDLIPAFLDEVRARKGVALAEAWNFVCEKTGLHYHMETVLSHEDPENLQYRIFWGDPEDFDSDQERQATIFLEALFAILEDLAPRGYVFGAHEGDGSDFGFWPIEETE